MGPSSRHGIFAAGSNPKSLAVADFNHDGKLDLAVADCDSWAQTGASSVAVLLDVIAAPTAMTSYSDAVGPTGATLHGTVNPRDVDVLTSYHFEYGITTAYDGDGRISTPPGSASPFAERRAPAAE